MLNTKVVIHQLIHQSTTKLLNIIMTIEDQQLYVTKYSTVPMVFSKRLAPQCILLSEETSTTTSFVAAQR